MENLKNDLVLEEGELELRLKKVLKGKTIEESKRKELIPHYIQKDKEKEYLGKIAMENFEQNSKYNYVSILARGSDGENYNIELKGL